MRVGIMTNKTDHARDARLPELPAHRGFLLLHNTGGVSQVWGYTAEQMHAYALEALARGAVDGSALAEVLDLLDNVTASNDSEADYLGQAENMLRNILTRQPAPPQPAAAPCCMCGQPVDTRENGTSGAQLTDGRWTCSEVCWERAAQPAAAGAVYYGNPDRGFFVAASMADKLGFDRREYPLTLYTIPPSDVGEGFVVVPREPTDAMLDSARIALGVEQDDFEIDDARTAYDAMLTAAPGEWPP